MAEPTIVDWLRQEVAKRLGPWTATNAELLEGQCSTGPIHDYLKG